jgi:hypothetical protein
MAASWDFEPEAVFASFGFRRCGLVLFRRWGNAAADSLREKEGFSIPSDMPKAGTARIGHRQPTRSPPRNPSRKSA